MHSVRRVRRLGPRGPVSDGRFSVGPRVLQGTEQPRAGGLWFTRDSVTDIAGKLGIEHARRVGEGPLLDAISLTRDGFASQMRSTAPEGLTMRPPVELLSRRGERIITKVKLKDFG